MGDDLTAGSVFFGDDGYWICRVNLFILVADGRLRAVTPEIFNVPLAHSNRRAKPLSAPFAKLLLLRYAGISVHADLLLHAAAAVFREAGHPFGRQAVPREAGDP